MNTRLLLLSLLVFLTACPKAQPKDPNPATFAQSGEVAKHGTDNALMAFVPPGPFLRGSTPQQAQTAFDLCERHAPESCEQDWFSSEQPQRSIDLRAFWIDLHEVTNVQYERCVRDGGCPPIDRPRCVIWDPGASDWAAVTPTGLRTHFGGPEQPAVCASWDDARTYCRWADKRLPTEAEWEKAARGSDGRTFPWGDATPTCEQAHMTSIKDGGEGCGTGRTGEVGRRPASASPFGVQDMSGNVLEWVEDYAGDGFYANSPQKDPVNTEVSERKVTRGGSWNNEPTFLRAANRGAFPMDFRTVYTGFRCAMSP